MRRAVIVAALGVLAVAVVAADAASPGFRYGVAAGEIESTSAVLWTRAPAVGTVRVELSLGSRVVATRNMRATPANDLTVQVRVTGLSPATR